MKTAKLLILLICFPAIVISQSISVGQKQGPGIIYRDIEDIEIHGTTLEYDEEFIDVDEDGTDDLRFLGYATYFSHLNYYQSNATVRGFVNMQICIRSEQEIWVENLDINTLINDQMSWEPQNNSCLLKSHGSEGSYGMFDGDGYFAFRITGADTIYGWMKVFVNCNGFDAYITIYEYAYFDPSSVYNGPEFAPPGAKWYYSYDNFYITGYVKIESVDDTIIDGFDYRVLQKSYFTYNYFDSTLSESAFGQEYVRQEGGKVLILRNNQLYTLFDFGAQPGDWWVIPATFSAFGACDSVGYVMVDSVGTAIINGSELRQLYISPMNGSDWGWLPYGDALIEKIGSKNMYLLPEVISGCVVDLFEGGPFRCYEDSEIGLYSVLTQGSCDSIQTGIYEYGQSISLSIFPNPCAGVARLQYLIHDIGYLKSDLYMISGNKIRELINGVVQPGEYEMEIDVSDLPAGVYLLKLQFDDNVVVRKLVVGD